MRRLPGGRKLWQYSLIPPIPDPCRGTDRDGSLCPPPGRRCALSRSCWAPGTASTPTTWRRSTASRATTRAPIPRLARIGGALFSLGHGAVVLRGRLVAASLPAGWQTPGWLEVTGVGVSIAFLFGLAFLNVRAVLLTDPPAVVRPVGLKARLLGPLRDGTRRGPSRRSAMLFALSFDTVSQAALFALAAGRFGGVAAGAVRRRAVRARACSSSTASMASGSAASFGVPTARPSSRRASWRLRWPAISLAVGLLHGREVAASPPSTRGRRAVSSSFGAVVCRCHVAFARRDCRLPASVAHAIR